MIIKQKLSEQKLLTTYICHRCNFVQVQLSKWVLSFFKTIWRIHLKA